MSRFVIHGRLPALNEIIDKSKTHWAKYSKLKKESMELVQYAILQHKVKPMLDKSVRLEIKCYEPNMKRDPDNVWSGAGKIILDALKQAGIITDDSQRYIKGIDYFIGVNKTYPRIEVTICPIEQK